MLVQRDKKLIQSQILNVVNKNGWTPLHSSILSNSILYNKQNGSIIITSRKIDDSTVINIQDTGIGIPEDKIDLIFGKFYRVDSTYTYEVSGVGLGLFITKNIFELHGIGYSINSKLGTGTDFKIMI